MNQMQARARRNPVDFPIALTFDHPGEGSFATSVNMSKTGMLVLSKRQRPPGTVISFESVPLSGEGKVVWARSGGDGGAFMGLEFTSVWRRDAGMLPSEAPPIDGDRAAWQRALGGESQGGPSFREATDQLLAQGITLAEISFALGSPVEALNRCRLDPTSPGYLRPPDDWKGRIIELATGRGPALDALARRLGDS